MSRSMGHPVLGRYGVSAEPEVAVCDLFEDDWLIIASDGLWDVLTEHTVAVVIGDGSEGSCGCVSLGACSSSRLACHLRGCFGWIAPWALVPS
jgi:serine/threonine protein phosphatase PrpC